MPATEVLQQLGRALDRAFDRTAVPFVRVTDLPGLGCRVPHAMIGAEMLRLARREPTVLVLPRGQRGRMCLDDLPPVTFPTPAGRTVVYRRHWFELEAS